MQILPLGACSLCVLLLPWIAGCGGEEAPATGAAESPAGAAGDESGGPADLASAESTTAGPDAGATPALPPGDPRAGLPKEVLDALQGEPVDPEKVVARVGDAEIRQKEVDARLAAVISSRSGREAGAAEVAQMRPMLGGQVVEELIDERLLDADADAAGVAIPADELQREFEEEIETYLLVNAVSREEFAERVEKVEGLDLDAFAAARSQDEAFIRGMRHMRLLAERYPDEAGVTPEEVQARYAESLEEMWSRPEMVRASHVLIRPDDESPEAVAAARAEAAQVADLARAEGADFAALAREHSDGPTGPEGGDVGFFPREDAVAESFAAAAFDLEVGEVSEPIQTEFGIHVIQVTDRRAAEVVPLETAGPAIHRMLEAEKLVTLRERRVAELRQSAVIERS